LGASKSKKAPAKQQDINYQMKGKASDILNKVPQQNQITKDNFEDYPHPYEINEER